MNITLAHSPDADDAFMFYGLARNKIKTGNVTVTHLLKDIQTLNEWALEGRFEASAISFHAYPEVSDKYALLSAGGSFGEANYGPMLIAKKKFSIKEIQNQKIAVPGIKTTAFLLLKLTAPKAPYEVVPFDRILDHVAEDKSPIGLIIHEGQLTYHEKGLVEVWNFGKWWHDQYQLPLPLGDVVVRRDLPKTLQQNIANWVYQSVQYGIEHFEEAIDYASQFGRGLSQETIKRFVRMYVNQRTINLKEAGKKSVEILLQLGKEKGIIKHPYKLDWVEPTKKKSPMRVIRGRAESLP